jgi:hypothetical protein
MTTDFTFKKISGTEQVEDVASTANVLIEDNGDIKRVSANQIGKVKTINGVEADENGNINIETEQVQADLTQNDENALDYVKGRTHWSEIVEEIVVDNLAVAMGEDGYYKLSTDFKLEIDKKYTVIWDGVEYICVAKNTDYGYTFIGNNALDSYASSMFGDTGEPFDIMSALYGVFVYAADSNSHTLTIKAHNEIIHKIDEKYLKTQDSTKFTIFKGVLTSDNGGSGTPYISGSISSWDDYARPNIPTNARQYIIFNGVKYDTGGNENIYNSDRPDTGEPFYYQANGYSGALLWKLYTREPMICDVDIYIEAENNPDTKSVKLLMSPKEFIDNNYIESGMSIVCANVYEDGSVEYGLKNNIEKVPYASGDTPTASEFNALIDALKNSGFMQRY